MAAPVAAVSAIFPSLPNCPHAYQTRSPRPSTIATTPILGRMRSPIRFSSGTSSFGGSTAAGAARRGFNIGGAGTGIRPGGFGTGALGIGGGGGAGFASTGAGGGAGWGAAGG